MLGIDIAGSKVNMKASVIKTKDKLNLKSSIFRVTRNNCFVIFIDYETIFNKVNPDSYKGQNKIVVFLLFSGIKNGVLFKKI